MLEAWAIKDFPGIPIEGFPATSKFYWYMNRKTFFWNYWSDIFKKTFVNVEYIWEYPVGQVLDQVYLLHYYPEDWPI